MDLLPFLLLPTNHTLAACSPTRRPLHGHQCSPSELSTRTRRRRSATRTSEDHGLGRVTRGGRGVERVGRGRIHGRGGRRRRGFALAPGEHRTTGDGRGSLGRGGRRDRCGGGCTVCESLFELLDPFEKRLLA